MHRALIETCTPEVTERWNTEWLRYLGKEWPALLTRGDYLDLGRFPADPLDLIGFKEMGGKPLQFYARREDILDKNVMEIGCGAGNLAKWLAPCANHYLGADYSTMALQIARLVCGPAVTFMHLPDPALEQFLSTRDTIVSRHFWIHQNFDNAQKVLRFAEAFLKPGGILYMDTFWPKDGVVRPPKGSLAVPARTPLDPARPSLTYAFTEQDVEDLLIGSPFRRIHSEVHQVMQRRYTILELIEHPVARW